MKAINSLEACQKNAVAKAACSRTQSARLGGRWLSTRTVPPAAFAPVAGTAIVVDPALAPPHMLWRIVISSSSD